MRYIAQARFPELKCEQQIDSGYPISLLPSSEVVIIKKQSFVSSKT